MDNTQKVLITAQALDAKGVQVSFTAPPVFVVDNPAFATLVALAAADPAPPAGQFSMWLVPVAGAIGTVNVSASEDAVLGDDTTKLTGSLAVPITAPIVPVDLAASIAITGAAAVKQ